MSTITANRPTPSTSTPQPLPSALTPSASGSNTTPRPAPGDSPERANKRARFNASGNAGPSGVNIGGHAVNAGVAPTQASGNSNNNGMANMTAGTPKDGKSAGTPKTPGVNAGAGAAPKSSTEDRVTEGMKWVKDKIGEMELLYKETILAAVLITQHKTYCLKIGLGVASIPLHMTQRLERSWGRYEALRRHVEYYLLQCAQAAATPSKPLTSLPTPGTLPSLGLTPLPAPSPNTSMLNANALLGFDPNISQAHTAQLEALAAQGQGMGDVSSIGPLQSMSGMGGMSGDLGMMEGSGGGDFDVNAFLASAGGAGDGAMADNLGADLSNLSVDELNALLQGGSFDYNSLSMPDMGGAGGGDGGALDISALLPTGSAIGTGSGTAEAADTIQVGQSAPPQQAQITNMATIPQPPSATTQPGTIQQPPQSVDANQTADALLASLQAGDGGLNINMNDMDFDFSSFGDFGGADLGDMDIDFAGMFGAGAQGQDGQGAVGGAGAAAGIEGAGVNTASNDTTGAQIQGAQVGQQQQPQQQQQQPLQRGQQQQQTQTQQSTSAPASGTDQQSGTQHSSMQQAYPPQAGQLAPASNDALSNGAGNDPTLSNAPATAPQGTAGAQVGLAVSNNEAAQPVQSAQPPQPGQANAAVANGNANPAPFNPFDIGFDPNMESIDIDDYDFGGMPAADGEEFENIFSEWK